MQKPYIKQILSYSMVGSLGLTIVASLQGCGGDQPPTPPPQNQTPGAISDATKGEGMFLVIQQTSANPDTYELKEKYPSGEGTRAILKDMNGNERILSEEELKKIAEEEAKKVEEGTSQLTQPVAQNQGLSLGETILASAAGALIGGMIANKLMGNPNYQQHQQQQASRAQTSISRPAAGGTDTRSVNQNQKPKSGFFGSNSGTANPSNRPSGGSSFGGGSAGG
ncbi:MAG: hypothetical protein KJ914_16290 [Gammaproteobacteria bacterium]|nr:hypothetical protein [Gammaproteobacteria bacterium]MBU1722448.1 hypothetical protein [Gammaproteobacteria bacterium]MBU2004947.1 hypothetical protein [Gammaproteobacteria bacterium]